MSRFKSEKKFLSVSTRRNAFYWLEGRGGCDDRVGVKLNFLSK